ncbi:transmembrane protease serine 9-like [Echeneis naucrates]|uniref:transmembrane protease serine 9-like n=1 Tax=Echeneis naucrates TaxID=173247 RepID=UPI001113C8C0|nr:transmembrane protease serine 9-like [Echeneis naucrates]
MCGGSADSADSRISLTNQCMRSASTEPQDRGRTGGPSRQLALAGQPAHVGPFLWRLAHQQPVGADGSSLNPTVFLGRQSQQQPNSNEVSREVTLTIIHPNYNPRTSDNDIALLRLNSAVTFTNFIRPVCLAASNSTFFNGTDSWVTGWGNIGSGVPLPFPQSLMEVEVPVVGNRQCNCLYGVGTITDNMICAGLLAGGRDSCQGDSGGPMVSKQGSVWVQSGIVSFGVGCAEPNFPGVYARVSQYQSWISSIITTNQPGFVTFTSSGTDGDLNVSCTGLPPVTTGGNSTTSTPPVTPPATSAPGPVVCGQAPLNSRILGGNSVASAGEWPWMASLQKNGNHMCGGTLVSEDTVLSSANCFSSSPNASEWTVILGRLTQNGSNPFEVVLNVTNITLSTLNVSNVAVLHLETKPTLTNYIQPICLDNGVAFGVGTTCWVAGWRSRLAGTVLLQELQTSVMDCGNASSSSDSICSGVFTLEPGDTGGPLMCKLNGSWFQAAVLLTTNSNSSFETREDGVMVFTKLSTFRDFLAATVGVFLSPFADSTTNTTNTTATTAAMTTSGGSPSQSAPFLFLSFLLLLFSRHLFS